MNNLRGNRPDSADPALEAVWYCVRTQPKQESKVAALLEREVGLEVISLSIRFRRLRRGAPIWVKEALFPGYLFTRFVYPQQHRHVRAISGVISVVQFGAKPVEVPLSIIDELRVLKNAGEIITVNPTIEPGAEVTVASGPLRGLRALVSRVFPARQRITILLEMLGAPREIEIETERVLPAHPRSSAHKV